MSPSISIILPVYNAEKYLRECVDSVLKIGERLDWELILVDDGSKDSSPSICDSFAEVNSRVRVLHLENGGVSNARNVGIAAATKDFVTFIDADDWIDADAFVKAFLAFFSFNAELGYVPFFSFEDGVCRENSLSMGDDRILSPEEKENVLEKKLGAGLGLNGFVWRCLFSRALVAGIEFDTSLKYNEDVLFCLETLYKAQKVAVINQAYYYYRVNQAQQLVGEGTYSLENRIAGWNKIKEWAQTNRIDFEFALMRRRCPIYARLFANAACENPRGIKRVKALWKIHSEIPSEESRQWKPDFWGKSFVPYSVLCGKGFRFLGFLYLCLRFF